MRQKTLMHMQSGEFKVLENEIFDIPTNLLEEFIKRVVNPRYPDGISSAIKDLMWKAVQKHKEKQVPPEIQQSQG
jgi:hypothetical protein